MLKDQERSPDAPPRKPRSSLVRMPRDPELPAASPGRVRHFEVAPRAALAISPAVQLLIETQQASGMPDARWAEDVFGISAAEWHKLRAGTTDLGLRTLMLVFINMPALRDRFIDALVQQPPASFYAVDKRRR